MIDESYVMGKIAPILKDNCLFREDIVKTFNGLKNDDLKIVLKVLNKNNIKIIFEKEVQAEKEIESKIVLDINELCVFSNEQLCHLYKQGNKIALDAIIKKNENLIWSRVRKYSKYLNHKLEDEDLFQSGSIGLIKAVDRYEEDKETNLTTYATWWIDQRIRRDIVDSGFTIRIPVHMAETVLRVTEIINRNNMLSYNEIKEKVLENGVSLKQFHEVEYIRKYILSMVSTNTLVGEDETDELIDFIEDNVSISIEQEIEEKYLKEDIQNVFKTLKERERCILNLRFGLEDGKQRTLEEVGILYGVTRERIRQIEAKAIRKLRNPSRSKKLKSYFIRE